VKRGGSHTCGHAACSSRREDGGKHAGGLVKLTGERYKTFHSTGLEAGAEAQTSHVG